MADYIPTPDESRDLNRNPGSDRALVLKRMQILPTTYKDTIGRRFTDAGRAQAKAEFLAAFAEHGTIKAGLRAARTTRDTVTEWLVSDKDFAEKYEHARLDYNDRLREEIDNRAVNGTTKEHRVYYKGDLVDVWFETEKSDGLLMFQARARMPEFRDKTQEDAVDRVTPEALANLFKNLPLNYQPGQGAVPGQGQGAVPGQGQAASPRVEPVEGEFTVKSQQRRPDA